MSLYDDLDTTKQQLPDQWGSSIKMLQSQLAIKSKQTQQKPNTTFLKKPIRAIAPINVIQKKDETLKPRSQLSTQITTQIITGRLLIFLLIKFIIVFCCYA